MERCPRKDRDCRLAPPADRQGDSLAEENIHPVCTAGVKTVFKTVTAESELYLTLHRIIFMTLISLNKPLSAPINLANTTSYKKNHL